MPQAPNNETSKKKALETLLKITKRRQELKKSKTDLALNLNMTTSGYFKIEKGSSKLDITRLFEILEVLEISPKVFFKDFK